MWDIADRESRYDITLRGFEFVNPILNFSHSNLEASR